MDGMTYLITRVSDWRFSVTSSRTWRRADGAPEGALGIRDVRVRFTNGMELSNNLKEQMMRRIKMNLKNACNIGSERSARHNAFMYSIIESCKMVKRNVEDYLKSLLERLRTARDVDDLTCCLPCYLPV